MRKRIQILNFFQKYWVSSYFYSTIWKLHNRINDSILAYKIWKVSRNASEKFCVYENGNIISLKALLNFQGMCLNFFLRKRENNLIKSIVELRYYFVGLPEVPSHYDFSKLDDSPNNDIRTLNPVIL